MDFKGKYLKRLLFFVILLMACKAHILASPLIGSYCISKTDTPNYRLRISEGKIPLLKDTIFNREKCLITYCPVTLTNNTNFTLTYISMTASWWDLYSVDNQNFKLAEDYWNVFKNGSAMITLLPNQSITKIIRVITYKSYFRGQQLRIGLSLQRLGFEFPDLNIIPTEPMSKTTNLIWSNAVTIR